jgi:prepilin-type N-terminal cleavage/methylation domain-containing protein
VKRKQNKGFTLAELLIVVAIIAVLVAISIPIFSNQLRKARFATNLANARAAKAAVIAGYFDTNGTRIHWNYDTKTGTAIKPWYDNALDRQSPQSMKDRGLPLERAVILGWIQSDPADWNSHSEKDLNGQDLRLLGDQVYSTIGVDLNEDGTVKYYYFYK